MPGARVHRPPQQPGVELGPGHDPHRVAEIEIDHQASRGIESTTVNPAGGKGIVLRALGQKGHGLPGQTSATRLLPRMRRIEDGDPGASFRELESGHRARGPGAHDADVHCPARISSVVTLEVPSLPTATPAAKFEITMAS